MSFTEQRAAQDVPFLVEASLLPCACFWLEQTETAPLVTACFVDVECQCVCCCVTVLSEGFCVVL